MRLIDADELILRLETQDYSGAPDTLEDWTPQDMTRAEIADINKMPTIDAAPAKHGKWIKYVDDDPTFDYQKCSACSEGWPMDNFYGLSENYCPNCGARMDGGKDDDKR